MPTRALVSVLLATPALMASPATSAAPALPAAPATLAAPALMAAPAAPAAPTLETLGPDAPPAADTRYRIGRQLYREGKFAAAAAEFKAALAMHPKSARLAYNLARSLERAGDLAGAIEHYERYLRLDPAASDRAEVEALIPTLRDRLQASWPTVAIVSRPGGASLVIDGRAGSAQTTPATLRLTPGPHTVRFELSGHKPEDRAIDLKTGASATLEVTLVPDPVATIVAPAPPPPIAETPWRLWAGYGALAAGAAVAGVGVIGHVRSEDAASQAEGLRPGPAGDARRDELQSEFDTQRAVMGLGYGIGAALLVTGATLLLWPDEEPTQTSSLRFTF